MEIFGSRVKIFIAGDQLDTVTICTIIASSGYHSYTLGFNLPLMSIQCWVRKVPIPNSPTDTPWRSVPLSDMPGSTVHLLPIAWEEGVLEVIIGLWATSRILCPLLCCVHLEPYLHSLAAPA